MYIHNSSVKYLSKLPIFAQNDISLCRFVPMLNKFLKKVSLQKASTERNRSKNFKRPGLHASTKKKKKKRKAALFYLVEHLSRPKYQIPTKKPGPRSWLLGRKNTPWNEAWRGSLIPLFERWERDGFRDGFGKKKGLKGEKRKGGGGGGMGRNPWTNSLWARLAA